MGELVLTLTLPVYVSETRASGVHEMINHDPDSNHENDS